MALNNPVQQQPPAWISPILLNGWANVGSGYATTQYRKFNSVVEIKGFIQSGNMINPLSGSILFNLPTGYRPLELRHFPQYANVQGSFAMGVFRISNNGDCAVFFNGNLTFFAIEARFLAEQ